MKGIGFYNNDFFVIKSDIDLIKEQITRLIMTNQGERVGQPYFGLSLKQKLFELDDFVKESIQDELTNQLIDYIPNIIVDNIDFISENNKLIINIKFTLKQNPNLSDEISIIV